MEDDFERRPGMSFQGLKRLVLNLLTVLVVLTTICVVGAFAAVFINPYISFNPYPPPTIPPTLGSPTPSNTPAKPLPSPWTSTPSLTPQPSETPSPTATMTPEPTEETTPEELELPFALQVGSPALIQNFVNDLGCEYMGVFGQVFDLENAPILNLGVSLGGELEGLGTMEKTAITGQAPDLGPGGYLIDIADNPIASQGTLWIQLDDGSGNPLSEQVFLETSDNCNENLIMVNWRQVR